MPAKSELALKWPIYQPRNWGKPSAGRPLPRPWFGLDTERNTDKRSKAGEFVCGWLVGEITKSFQRLTDFTHTGSYWIWNLGYDIEGLLRDLNVEEIWAAKVDGAPFPMLDGEARYFHGKRFDFKHPNGAKISFLEASSFFGRVPLSKIGSKEGVVKGSEMSLNRYNDSEDFITHDGVTKTYREWVDSYCQQDARIVYNAVCGLDAGVKAIGVELGATPGATARRFMTRLGQFPSLIWESHKPFLKSYCGGRFEIVKRGVINQTTYQYDIVSAYPWALANCPWLTESAFRRWTNRFSEDAIYGSYLVSFEFDSYLGVAPRWKDGIRVYSTAQKETWLARPEVEFLIKRGAKVEIKRALEIFDPNASGLWNEIITELFRMKEEGNECFQKLKRKCGIKKCPDCEKKTPEGLGAKIVLNSMYGVLIQLVRRAGVWVPLNEAVNPVDWAGMLALEEPPKEFEGGKYLAPVYAGNLTSLTRVKLLDAALSIGPGFIGSVSVDSGYIGGHTDSVLTTIPLPERFLGTRLGDFKLEKEAPRCDVSQTGKYAIGNTVKVRGITRKGTAELLWMPEHTRNARIGIKSAKSWDDVSVIVPKKVANNFEIEKKRQWDRPLTLEIVRRGEFVDSRPFAYV